MTCIILGLAPHLDQVDLTLLEDQQVFVCNRFYRIYGENPPFLPLYYMCSDRRVWRREWETVCKQRVILMLGDVLFDKECPLHNWTPGRSAGREGDPLGFGPAPQPDFQWYGFRTIHRTNDIRFGTDPDHGFWNGGTVAYDMLQMAAYMGYSRIGFLGVELKWPKNADAPTHAGGMDGRKHAAFRINTGYARKYFSYAAQKLRKRKIEIFNLAPEGRSELDVFPQMSLEAFTN